MIYLNNYLYGGATDIGYKRETNEDYINIIELDSSTLFAALADGAGSKCVAARLHCRRRNFPGGSADF